MRRPRFILTSLVLVGLAAAPLAASAAPHACRFVGHLAGRHEVPSVETRGQGQILLDVDRPQETIAFKLISSNVEAVTSAHLHLGTASGNGPVVVQLAGGLPPGGGTQHGVLAEGVITEADLVGPLAGAELKALVDALASGQVYANVHTEEVPSGEIRGQLRLAGRACPDPDRVWKLSCGDPVCRGYVPPDGVPRCASEREGDTCDFEGDTCDPIDDCNRLLVCTSEPIGPCPISRREAKRDVHYLGADEIESLAEELLAFRLATYRYTARGPDAPLQLGFMIDDVEPSPSVDCARDMVDLYGYTSMTVAALQSQALAIESLRAELETLRRRLEDADGTRDAR